MIRKCSVVTRSDVSRANLQNAVLDAAAEDDDWGTPQLALGPLQLTVDTRALNLDCDKERMKEEGRIKL